ncbi:MAG: Hsp70 family protein [Alphaproteobacteria bacterium]|nr:Hsp70 family protein [Alphaproteobacteria bacterium]
MYLGIDLGTSNSAIAGIVDGKVRIFRPVDGGEVLPSVIYFDKRGHRLYGHRAHDQALISPENVAAGFKRLMGTSTPIEVKGAELTLTPEECSAEIIRQLLGQAATETGGDKIVGAVITVPTSFNQMQSEATLRAAKMAGLEHVDLLQEPIAAALAAMEGAKRSGRFLIYDLGGGTFDAVLAQAINGQVDILAHQGINMLGGRDFDRMIVNEVIRPWLTETFDLPENFHRDPAYRRLIRIAQLAAEKAKIDLSSQERTSILASDEELRITDQNEMEMYLDIPFSREQFEALIRDPIMQTINMIRMMLEDNNTSFEEIDRIVFIGGPSRIPLVREMVSTELGIPTDMKTDPLTAVAIGAAYYCESRQWGADNKSAPKPTVAAAEPPEAPQVSYSYTSRTPDDKTVVTVHLSGEAPETRQLKIVGKIWSSGILPLTNDLTVQIPLIGEGEHTFIAHILDSEGQILEPHDQTLTITRLVAAAQSIPAAQTIAIKALPDPQAQENTLLPLVEKGDPLPAKGRLVVKSGRSLKAQEAGHISFELFQIEYEERLDLNLCVGVFRIGGEDLPEGFVLEEGTPLVFSWQMNESGILQASVLIQDESGTAIDLKTPRFYAPQIGQISFAGDDGVKFTSAIVTQGEEDWGDLAAALGPEGDPEVRLLKMRLQEQNETLHEFADDPETLRHVAEEARFIRQDIARIGKKHRDAVLQRRLGKMTAVFNRIARPHADQAENDRFDNHTAKVQEIIERGDESFFGDADLHLSEMRDLFFAIAWRDPDYVRAWFKRLSTEPYLFPDKDEFQRFVEEGESLSLPEKDEALRDLVKKMLAARIAMGASDTAGELASIVKA